jgi:SET domain
MAPAKGNKSRSGKHKGTKAKNETEGAAKDTPDSTPTIAMFAPVVVLILAYIYAIVKGGHGFFSSSTVNVGALSPLDRLMYYWPSGGRVRVVTVTTNSTDGSENRGLVATRPIRKGSVAVVADYMDLEGEMSERHPELPFLVGAALQTTIQEQQAKFASLTAAKVMGLLRFLELVDIEKDPKWVAYADTLPKSVPGMAWYWTHEERKCVVSRPKEEQMFENLEVFHGTMAKLVPQSELVKKIYNTNPMRAEWAYLMMYTRGFGEVFFLPLLDMGNHNPLKAAPTFFVRDHRKVYLVAPRDIPAGEPVYNTYGPLTPIQSAAVYGFVESEQEAAYLESPSIHQDLLRSEFTNTIPQCTKESPRFFGNVGDQVVEAQLGEGEGSSHKYSLHFKAFMPTQLAHACLRVLLQSEKDEDMARYVAEGMESDYQRYIVMATAKHCQSDEGNFPLIRRANEVMASLMWEAYEVAEKAASSGGKIAYPGIESYNNPPTQ